jgi:hypothetical protein
MPCKAPLKDPAIGPIFPTFPIPPIGPGICKAPLCFAKTSRPVPNTSNPSVSLLIDPSSIICCGGTLYVHAGGALGKLFFMYDISFLGFQFGQEINPVFFVDPLSLREKIFFFGLAEKIEIFFSS